MNNRLSRPGTIYDLGQQYPQIEPRIINGELNEIPALLRRQCVY